MKDQNGQEHTFDETHLMNDIAQNGATPTGVSADGLTITFQGSKGPYQAPVTDVLAKMGYNSVGIKPIDFGEEHVCLTLAARSDHENCPMTMQNKPISRRS